MSGLRYPLAPPYYSQGYENFRNQWIARSFQDRGQILRYVAVPAISWGELAETTDTDWATKHAAATATADTHPGRMDVGISSSATTNQWDLMQRGVIHHDTSALLRSTSVVTAARLLLLISPGTVTDNYSQSLVLVAGPDNYPPVVTGDYDGFGSTDLADRLTFTSLGSGGASVAFNLNDAGLAHIDATGVTSWGIRCSADVDNSEPTWAGSTDAFAGIGTGWTDPLTYAPLSPSFLELLFYY